MVGFLLKWKLCLVIALSGNTKKLFATLRFVCMRICACFCEAMLQNTFQLILRFLLVTRTGHIGCTNSNINSEYWGSVSIRYYVLAGSTDPWLHDTTLEFVTLAFSFQRVDDPSSNTVQLTLESAWRRSFRYHLYHQIDALRDFSDLNRTAHLLQLKILAEIQ
jgi:hypothetical protein